MKTYCRAFTAEFCSYTANHTGFPPGKAAVKWFRKDIDGIKDERYKLLREGHLLNEKYALSLIRMLQQAAADETPNHIGKVFAGYLQMHGLASPADASIEQIAELVCEPRQQELPPNSRRFDFLQQGLDAIVQVVSSRRLLDRYQQNCSTDELIHDAATWLFVSGGRLTGPKNANLSPDEALLAGKNYIGISRDEYAERMTAWHEFNPWTVVLARGNKRPNGVSVVLPLSDAGYADLLNGVRPTYDSRPEYLSVPTRQLLIEIIAERPHDLGADDSNPTRGMYANLFAQVGVFLRPLDFSQDETIRLLTYADMPLFVKRLKAFGFKATGRKMQTTGLPFYEKTLRTKSAHGRDSLFVAALKHFSEIFDSPPPE